METDWSGLLRSRDGAAIEILSDIAGIGRPGARFRHIRRRHARDGQPFLLANEYLGEHLAARITPLVLRTKTALKLIAGIQGVRIADSRQTLTIGMADVETAAAPHLPLNAPIAHVLRATTNLRGVLLLVAEEIYRGDMVRIDITLR